MSAMTFVVPPDRELVRQATAIVIATAVASHTEPGDGHIETVTQVTVEETLKGTLPARSFDIREPGGVDGVRATIIPGVPWLTDGSRYLLFLVRTDAGVWRILNLALGAFCFAIDDLGHHVVVREMRDIIGWDANGAPHREQNRAEEAFLAFIRAVAAGRPVSDDYAISARPLIGALTVRSAFHPTAFSTYTANSYTYISMVDPPCVAPGCGPRWTVFPSPVTFYSVGSEPGAPGNPAGSSAITAAFAAWNGEPNSNVNYVYGGADTSGTHMGLANRPDDQNTIYFEQDLMTLYGAPAFTCSDSGNYGNVGQGGFTNTFGKHTGPNGEVFATGLEADVLMNRGIANCTSFLQSGDFNTAVAAEVGRTLGFRHSNETRSTGNASPCIDSSLECSSSALMTTVIVHGLSGALQAWDQHAVAAVYPNGPAPNAPRRRAARH